MRGPCMHVISFGVHMHVLSVVNRYCRTSHIRPSLLIIKTTRFVTFCCALNRTKHCGFGYERFVSDL